MGDLAVDLWELSLSMDLMDDMDDMDLMGNMEKME